mgnify:CR=1 FL=1
MKLFKTKNDAQIKSLTARWLIDVLSIVVLIVVILEIIASIVIYNYYYNSVRQDLTSRLNVSTDILNEMSSSTDYEFELNAKSYLSDYYEKNALEVQIFDRFGKIIASSRGFLSDGDEYYDYNLAKQNESAIGEWSGKSETGESVMAMTKILPSTDKASMGAIRFIVSLDAINSTIWNSILVAIGCGLLVIAIVVISGALFLRSIIVPIRAITDTAFRIASGDFEARLPVSEKDESEVGKLCDTINYMASELESSDKLKNDFISSVSHELRTPLTAIKGWGETVKMSLGTDDELTEKGMDIIIKETGRLSGLVEDLLDFSRLQSGRLSVKLEKCDILAELEEAVLMYRETASKSGIRLIYNEPENLPPVMADPGRIKQVFINIIDNAVKYSKSGDTVIITASLHDIYVQVTVADTGCGIAAEDLGKVKEKFYKANTNVQGSGIGLAVADEIVKQHNGILEVDSKQDEGTIVSIILPFITNNEQISEEGTGEIE